MNGPEAVTRSSPFVVTAVVTDYAHDAAVGVQVEFTLPQSLQPKSVTAPGWRCTALMGVFTCGAESIPAGASTIALNMVAPTATGAIDIQARSSDSSGGYFDPFHANDTGSVHVRVFDPAACSSESPVIQGPSDGTTLAGGRVSMSWTSVGGAAGYRVWTAVEGADARILGETSGTALAADVPIGSTEWWIDALFDLCPTSSSTHLHFVSNGAPLQWSVSDFAGQAGVHGNHDGASALATFETPSSLGIDTYGTVVVADSEASTLRPIDAAGSVATLAGQSGKTGSVDGTQSFSLLNHPEAVAVAPGGFTYVADSANQTIREYFPTGDGIATFTPFLGTLAGSAGSSGSKDGQGAAARFDAPGGIAVMPDFTVFVSDTGANRIRRISVAGAVTSLTTSTVAGFADGSATGARFNGPTGLAVDSSGNLFIADTENHIIRRLGTDGNVTTIAGTPTIAGFSDGRGAAATFNRPTALALDALGNLYVADTGNDAIRMVAPSGLVTTMIGTGRPGHVNGPGRAAMLDTPTGLAVDAAGRLLIADAGNRVLRVATAAPQPSVPAVPQPRRRAAQH
jgi:sugar lactone lactonase YvrE